MTKLTTPKEAEGKTIQHIEVRDAESGEVAIIRQGRDTATSCDMKSQRYFVDMKCALIVFTDQTYLEL